MQKNVASQKLIVFAFDSTTNLPKTGDAANITAYVSIDYGSVTVLGDTSATEMDATNAKGYYLFDLTQSETNGNTLLFSAKSSTSNIVVIGAPSVVQTVPAAFIIPGGAAGGFAIAGSNAATTFVSMTCTGAFTISDGLLISRSSGNTSAITATGNGTGSGIVFTSGSGATGDGVQATAASTNGNGLALTKTGSGVALKGATTDMVVPTVTAVTNAVTITSNIKKNQALTNFEFLMTDSTNHNPATGKAVTCTRSIDGGAFGAGTLANTTEIGVGIYEVDFGAGDLNGKVITLRATATGCDDLFVTILTQA